MFKTKSLLGLILMLVMVVVPVMSVGAASPAQTTTIDGTIKSCETATDNFTGETIVVCEINLAEEGTQTVRLSVDDAVEAGLAILNEDGTVTIIAVEEQEVSIDSSLLMSDPCEIPEGVKSSVSKAMTSYFCESLGTSYYDLQTLHENGFGFGEIAQACFMALKLEGTGSLCADILYAKKSGDYSNLTLPDNITVSNWGQLRKAVVGHEKNSSNLGSIVSDKAKDEKVKENKEKNNGQSDQEHGKNKK